MTLDDDDDDFVVPSGTRRSSYVPPADDTDYVPSMPPAAPDAPTSSTGPLPSIGAVGDDAVAQTPSFADSAEIEPQPEFVIPPIVIEVPAAEPVSETAVDQFGLPVLAGEPIDIPRVVVDEPMPEALPGTGSVFDDNRLFPSVDTHGALDEVVEDPIVEEFGVSATVSDTVAPHIEAEAPASVEPVLSEPTRQSLTPAGLAEVLAGNGGMSSNEQMALLDAQIPLREADAAAIAAFAAEARALGTPAALDALTRVSREFADIAPELAPAREYSDDSTPVSGNPVVDHIEIVEVVEDANHDVVAVSVTEVDVVELPVVENPTPHEDDQSWSLPSPTDVVDEEEPTVERRHWWTLAGYGAIVSTLIVAGFAHVVAISNTVPLAWIVVAGVAAAIPFLEPARHFHVRTGGSWRMGLEEVFGRVPGRVAAGGFAAIVALALILVVTTTTAGLGTQLELSKAIGPILASFVPAGSTGPVLAALALLGGAIIAALPHRWYRAKILVLTGWSLLGTGTVAAMGTFIVLSSQGAYPNLGVVLAQFGGVASVALVLLPSALDGLQPVTRVREGKPGALWLYIGLGFGLVTTAGVVTAALLAQGGAHFFFANNPVVHIIAPSALLNEVLGALAFVPAILLMSALGFRAMSTATTRDDREEPNTLVGWLLTLKPIALGVVGYLGLAPLVLDYFPSASVLAVPVGAVLGVLAARGVIGREITKRGAKRGLLSIGLVAIALGWGFAASSGAFFGWVGYINAALRPYGYGLLYIDSLAPIATAVFAFLLSLIVVAASTRRAKSSV